MADVRIEPTVSARTGARPVIASDLTVINASIIDGTGSEPFEGSIRIEAGRIVEVGTDVPPGERVIDARGGSVLPGLIDAHLHAFATYLTGTQGIPMTYVGIMGARRLTAALRRGFTTVRDPAGGDPAFERAAREGLFPSPRYLYTGEPLSQTGGHGDQRDPESSACAHPVEIVDGVEAMRVAARDRFRRGAHAIKIMTSGGVISPSDPIAIPQYSAEEIRAVVDEATRRGSYVIAHSYSAESVRHSVRNGVRSIEHGNLIDAPTAKLMAEHSAFLVPTLAAYDAMGRRAAALGLPPVSMQKNAEVLDAGQRAIELARDAGVSIGFGSDLMGELEDEQLNGLRLQAEVLGVLETIRCATSVNAALIQRDDLGRIAADCIGDLLILDGNLIFDPTVLWDDTRPRTVIRSGQVMSAEL
ncbi:amidohydrolase family protein [Microlunatus elymi]|uniref:Amidohydrolase family protein n=1 Tax=Microlunatus elymi TaxID=2596828 RepID=A0A516PVI7_9ACTN|nr:amidohydrolase family protein [Microlunatus elymi]QDP95208.1 amidohydrolase family protein [Microlunatus elymi]